MLEHDVLKFYKAMGMEQVGRRPGWVLGRCPYAPWTHQKGFDRKPSFAISVTEGQSHFNCFSCGTHGDLHDLVMDMREVKLHSPEDCAVVDFKAAMELLADEELASSDYDIPDYEEAASGTGITKLHPFPEEWLATFLPGVNHPYLAQRGISLEVAKALDLRFDTKRKRLCFPIRDWAGTLCGLHGRDVTGESELRWLGYTHGPEKHSNPHIWLNEQNVDLGYPVIVTEGGFDLAKIMHVNTNVLAAHSVNMPPLKLRRLRSAHHIITWFDAGAAGDTARALIDKHLGHTAHIDHVEPTEEEGDAGDTPIEEIQRVLSDLLD